MWILGLKGLREGINNTANAKGGTGPHGLNLKKIGTDCNCGF